MNNEQLPLAMAESFWANSHLSIARYTGRIHLGKYDYVICHKDGKDIFQCSLEAEKAGREKANANLFIGINCHETPKNYV